MCVGRSVKRQLIRAGRAEALPHCWRLPRRFPEQMRRSGNGHFGCAEGDCAIPSAVGCVAQAEGGVPRLGLTRRHGRAGGWGWGRLQTIKLSSWG